MTTPVEKKRKKVLLYTFLHFPLGDCLFIYKNYPNISNILFKDKFINPYNLANKEENINMLEVKNLYLIRNRITDITFHSFPTIPRNLIKDSIEIGDNDDKYKSIQNSQKCFITRSIENSGVLNRCLSNQLEIENILERNSFVIINPEKISFDDLINNLRFPTLIVITWGSALTNLNFLNPKTKVFILKSKNYRFVGLRCHYYNRCK